MKKFISLIMALLLVFSVGFGAFAEGNEADGGIDFAEISQEELQEITGLAGQENIEMFVNFDISEGYTVTIPASIKLSGSFNTGFTGSAEIGIIPSINSSKSVVVSLNTQLFNPVYYVGGSAAANIGASVELSKVSFSSDILQNGVSSGNTASVEITGKNPLRSFGLNAVNGVIVASATGTVPASNELIYSVSGVSGLSSGSYGFPQTFNITVG